MWGRRLKKDKQEHKGRALRQCIWDGTTIGDKLGIWSYASHSRKVEKWRTKSPWLHLGWTNHVAMRGSRKDRREWKQWFWLACQCSTEIMIENNWRMEHSGHTEIHIEAGLLEKCWHACHCSYQMVQEKRPLSQVMFSDKMLILGTGS